MKKLTFQNAYSKLCGFTLCALFSTFAYISCFSTILIPFPTISLYLGSSISIMYATLLLILSKTYDGYRYPGYLQFVNGICLLVLILLLSVQNVSAIQWIAIIVGEMCRILSEYLEYRTHSKAIHSKLEELSKQWNIGKQYCSFEFNGSCVFATVRTVYIYSRRYHSCNCLHKEDQLLKKDSWFIRKRKRMILFLKIG